MKYKDNDRKFVSVINRNADVGDQQNASQHAMVGLMAKLVQAGRLEDAAILEYHQHGGLPSVLLSTYPVIVLRSKNSSQLNTLRAKAEATDGVFYNYFSTSMNAGSADEQRERTRSTPIDQQEFLAVMLFGDAEKLAPLTKKVSIYTGSKPAEEPADPQSQSSDTLSPVPEGQVQSVCTERTRTNTFVSDTVSHIPT